MARADDRRFAELTFDDFRRLATDPSLSPYEKIGFPDSYREGYEPAIFADIEAKLPPLRERREQVVLDIGPGCSELPAMVRRRCEENEHTLLQLGVIGYGMWQTSDNSGPRIDPTLPAHYRVNAKLGRDVAIKVLPESSRTILTVWRDSRARRRCWLR